MGNFEITDSKGKNYSVSPMDSTSWGFYLSDNNGHLQEIGRHGDTNKWIKMFKKVSLSPFNFDIQEVGKLIEDYYSLNA